jgi:hypothetical protein
MEKAQESYTIFEDQDDYIEDVRDQFRSAIKRYTLYAKMFGRPKDYKSMKDELRKFVNYEVEKTFSSVVIKESGDGGISMRFDENE